MKKMIAANLVALRAMIKKLRAEYSVGMDRFKRREFRRGSEVHLQWCQVQARLIYLVPLYRALHAVHQQTGDLHSQGVDKYKKLFDTFRAKMRDKQMMGGSLEFYFGGEVAELQLLIPVSDVSPKEWIFGSIADIAQQVAIEIAAAQVTTVKHGRDAENARQAFLSCLSEEQLQLLQNALTFAGKRGYYCISIDRGDLDKRLVY